MLFAVMLGFIVASLMPVLGRWIRNGWSVLLTAIPLYLFIYFLSFVPGVAAGNELLITYSWIPSMGVNFSFLLDGLSLLFALMITGIGTLVFLYTTAYLKGDPYLDRFFGYLSLFMGAMLGMVLSENIFTLFTFWELTSISSFFLIGYNNTEKASRVSAIKALTITGLGGFFLLGGMALMSNITGTYSITEMLGSGDIIKQHPMYPLLAICIFIGAFTKSAQFPFHFWLPGAMKAPTPVSTYLHSATMVKAGIYVLARFTPILGDSSLWNYTLMAVGGITMLYAAYISIFKSDLKEILAFSTISALGILVFLLGLGTKQSIAAFSVFILVHALYKATLFLVTGIVDHETHTRNIFELSGLRKVLMPVAIAGFLAMLANSGIPPTLGFIGKDLIYESTLSHGFFPWAITIVAIITNIFLVYSSILAGIKPFAGKLPESFQAVHLPSWRLWLPPLALSIKGIIFGFMPGILEESIFYPVSNTIFPATETLHLKLWHGFNLILLLSTVTIAGGILLYFSFPPAQGKVSKMEKFARYSPPVLAGHFSRVFRKIAVTITNILQNGYLRFYIMAIVGFLIILLAYKAFTGVEFYIDPSRISPLTSAELVVMLILIISLIYAVYTPSRLSAVAAMGVMGYCICLLFVFYSAPDLAMTQFTIDTLTVILFVLVLYRLPKYINYTNWKIRLRDGIISLVFGSLITALAFMVYNEPTNKETSQYFANNSYTLAHGRNVVNVIIVDFRGLDTMIEITVLTISAIGVFSLLKLQLNKYDQEL